MSAPEDSFVDLGKAQIIIDGVEEILAGAEIALGGLDGAVAEQ